MVKKNIAIICPTGNFGGMELDSIKLVKKLNPYCNIVFITKKDGFLDNNFRDYISNRNTSLFTSNWNDIKTDYYIDKVPNTSGHHQAKLIKEIIFQKKIMLY